MHKALLPLCGCLLSLLSACGGVADHSTTHRLSVRVLRRDGQPAAGQSLSAAVRAYPDAPFSAPQSAVTDARGRAEFAFAGRWGSAFLVLPPLGNVPARPPKPDYRLSLAGREQVISAREPAPASYRWEGGDWRTEATVAAP